MTAGHRHLGRPGTVWLGTSWKMTKTLPEARIWSRIVRDRFDPAGAHHGVQPFVVPPATAIATVAAELGPGSPVLVGAQDAHWEDAGAWTGEVSVPQVADAGARLVELGHSERRTHMGDTDERVRAKVDAVLRHGLMPLLCVGEGSDARARGGHVEHVLGQVRSALGHVTDRSTVLVAYEPVWAIGDAGRAARPDEVAEVVAAVRRELPDVAAVLYGGSVSPGNAADMLAVDGVDGLFVGRSAWPVNGFLELLGTAAGAVRA